MLHERKSRELTLTTYTMKLALSTSSLNCEQGLSPISTRATRRRCAARRRLRVNAISAELSARAAVPPFVPAAPSPQSSSIKVMLRATSFEPDCLVGRPGLVDLKFVPTPVGSVQDPRNVPAVAVARIPERRSAHALQRKGLPSGARSQWTRLPICTLQGRYPRAHPLRGCADRSARLHLREDDRLRLRRTPPVSDRGVPPNDPAAVQRRRVQS
jgi:hypothetical protein